MLIDFENKMRDGIFATLVVVWGWCDNCFLNSGEWANWWTTKKWDYLEIDTYQSPEIVCTSFSVFYAGLMLDWRWLCNDFFVSRRYIFNLYKEKQISRQLYDFLIKHKLADPLLIAMWKKVWKLKVFLVSLLIRLDMKTCVVWSVLRTVSTSTEALAFVVYVVKEDSDCIGAQEESSKGKDCRMCSVWLSRMC